MEIGRNEPCPCGSGKKYKRCHLLSDEIVSRPVPFDPEEMREIRAIFQKHEAEEAARKKSFGEVRPVIHADFQDHKFVVVGGELHYAKDWRTFPDFLFHYIKNRLNREYGEEWAKTEMAKPLGTRHPILRWYDGLCHFQGNAEKGEDGLYSAEMDGPSAAYILLAYDLYILADNRKLQTEVLRRLKDINTFHAARFELSVAATMIRAGFDIEYEDESDNTRRHPEFIAKDKKTGESVAVEAKVRRRAGVMGWLGSRPTPEDFRVSVDHLLRDAIGKSPDLPYVIFIDANMPPEVATGRQEEWVNEVQETVQRVGHGFGRNGVFEGVPFTCLVVTNHPHDYAGPGEKDPPRFGYLSAPLRPVYPFSGVEVMNRIQVAVKQYGNVPNEFPQDS